MYAEKKGWHLRNVEVRLNHKNLAKKDCNECEAKDLALEEIHSQIILEGNLDESMRSRMLEIAVRCPIHRTLSSNINIRSELI